MIRIPESHIFVLRKIHLMTLQMTLSIELVIETLL